MTYEHSSDWLFIAKEWSEDHKLRKAMAFDLALLDMKNALARVP